MNLKDARCITQEVTLEVAERQSLRRTRKVQLAKKPSSHSSALLLIPTSATARTLLCGALSNALIKSNDKMSYE